MPTVGKSLADQVIAKDGYYSTDPRVMRVVEYDNAWGGVSYGLEYAHQIGNYSESDFVRNPRVIWRAGD